MAAALRAIGALKPGFYIQMHHWREPRLLYEKLVPMGCSYDTRLGSDGNCEIFIWKDMDQDSAEAAARAAEKLPKWSD